MYTSKKDKKFYDFEDKIIAAFIGSKLHDGLTLQESQEFTNRVCASYAVLPPRCVVGRSIKVATYNPLHHVIKLPIWAQRTCIVLHEVAHAIDRKKNGLANESHGPQYVKVWIELFGRMYDLSQEMLTKEANRHGLI